MQILIQFKLWCIVTTKLNQAYREGIGERAGKWERINEVVIS